MTIFFSPKRADVGSSRNEMLLAFFSNRIIKNKRTSCKKCNKSVKKYSSSKQVYSQEERVVGAGSGVVVVVVVRQDRVSGKSGLTDQSRENAAGVEGRRVMLQGRFTFVLSLSLYRRVQNVGHPSENSHRTSLRLQTELVTAIDRCFWILAH